MPRVAGYSGQVDAGGVVNGIREWSIDYVAAALDDSGYDGGQDKTFIIGQKEWSGSFSGFKNQAPLAIGVSLLCLFHEDSAVATQNWEGNAFITNIRPSSSVDGVVTYAYDFQGTGALITIPTT
jgi:hypothetical protein